MTIDGWLLGAGGRVDPRAASTAHEANANAAAATRQVQDLEDRVDRLTLVCSALWSLLRERTGLTEEQLLERVKEIDLADGRLDGKVPRQAPATCGACGRTFAARHARCIWCGAERTAGGAFDRVR
jgi:hypothetical protein